MEEAARQALSYLQASWALNLATAFIGGVAARKTVTAERKAGWFISLVIGLAGFFLGKFVLISCGASEYLDALPNFRAIFDLLTAYVGSFFIAAAIHFLRPV